MGDLPHYFDIILFAMVAAFLVLRLRSVLGRRTGNERRLSDFLLWECAFAELHFSDCFWPDFDAQRFNDALEDYGGRQRRFGGLTAETR